MSFILNALRKSEQERQAKQPESVTDRILIQQQPKKSRRTFLWICAILVLNLLLIASGFYWFSQKTSDPAPAKSAQLPAETTLEKTIDQPPVETIQPKEQFAQRRQRAATSIVEQIAARRRQRNPEHAQGELQQTTPTPAPTPSTEQDKPLNIQNESSDASSDEPDEEGLDSVPDDEPAMASEPITKQEIPYLDELPYEIRRSIPRMTINVFFYAPDPNERFVIINMAKYKSGQQTKDSVELKEIRQNSLVASYQGHTFQLERP